MLAMHGKSSEKQNTSKKAEKTSKKVLTFPFRGDILSELSGTTVKKKASEATKEQNSSLTTEQ